MDYIYKAKEAFKHHFRLARDFLLRPAMLRQKWNAVYAEWLIRSVPRKYNIMLPCGLGDTRFMIQISQKLERKLGGEIVFFIRPSHEIVFKMFGRANYSVMQSMDCERDVFLSSWKNSKRRPEKGRLFLGHWHFNEDSRYLYEYSMATAYCRYWNIDLDESDYISPSFFPMMEQGSPLSSIDYDKTVLICPEAFSGQSRMNMKLFRDISRILKKKGYRVIANISKPDNRLSFAENLSLDLEDMLLIAAKSKAIISARSGFCDIVAEKKEKLFIIHETCKSMTDTSISELFGIKGIHEFVYKNTSAEQICEIILNSGTSSFFC